MSATTTWEGSCSRSVELAGRLWPSCRGCSMLQRPRTTPWIGSFWPALQPSASSAAWWRAGHSRYTPTTSRWPTCWPSRQARGHPSSSTTWPMWPSTLRKRVEWFWRKKMLHIVCCTKLLLDPYSKISCLNVAALSLVARPLKFWTFTLKSTTTKNLKPFWSLLQWGMYSLIF